MLTKDYILSKSVPEPNSGCWLWEGFINDSGYGKVVKKGKTIAAHRMSYELFNGEIPLGLLVLHKCDNRMCVNPDHLYAGTHKENAIDMVTRMRGTAKLTKQDIVSIRSDTRLLKTIATEYNVSEAQICRVRNRKTWIHFND